MDLAKAEPERLQAMERLYQTWFLSMQVSVLGQDYPDDFDQSKVPKSGFWLNDPRYQKILAEWEKYPGLQKILKDSKRRAGKK